MSMMRQCRGFTPAEGRTPGDADYPVAVRESRPDLPPVGDVTVGVVDIGLVVDRAGNPHPWFADHVAFVPDEAYSLPDEPLSRFDGHADFVTGLILREAPTARVRVTGVLDHDDVNKRVPVSKAEDGRVAAAITALATDEEQPVQVINLSFSGEMFTVDSEATDIQQAISAHPHIAFVAAAGNDARDDAVWPAAFDGVYAVGALDERRVIPPGATPPIASFSNRGPWVDGFDGGVQELSSFPVFDDRSVDQFRFRVPQEFGGWARWSGTSFAAARVSGRIARIVAEHGGTGADAAKALLEASPVITAGGGRWLGGAHVP